MANKRKKMRSLLPGGYGIREKDLKYLSFNIGYQIYIEDLHDNEGGTDADDTHSTVSYSTNATTDNIPGTGRILDKAYQALGRKLERAVNKTALRFRSASTAVIVEPNDDETSSQTDSTCSTNATMDNIPGPGRVIDNAYQFFGRKLEKSANRIVARFSLVNPPPDQILHHFMQDYQDSPSIHYVRSYPLDFTLKRISEHQHGELEVWGFQSLVKQTQSNSIYRSAAALTALIRLSTTFGEGDTSFTWFYIEMARTERIFHLETLVRSLDETHPEKALFSSLVGLARIHSYLTESTNMTTDAQATQPWREQLLTILESWRVVGYDPVVGVANACILLAEILAYMLRDDRPAAHTKLTETAYFTFIFLMHSTYALRFGDYHHLTQPQQMVLPSFIYYSDVLMDKMIGVFSNKRYLGSSFLQAAALIRSPIIALPRCNYLLPITFSRISQPILRGFGPSRRMRHSTVGNLDPTIIRDSILAYVPRSRRLLLSLDELEREAREQATGFQCVISHLEANISFTEESLARRFKRSLDRARQAQVQENRLTLEFLNARNGPDDGGDSLQQWASYKENCLARHHMGQLFRSNLDWDWDLSSMLQRLLGEHPSPSDEPLTGKEMQIKRRDNGTTGESNPPKKDQREKRNRQKLQRWASDVEAAEDWWKAKIQESIAMRECSGLIWRSMTLQ